MVFWFRMFLSLSLSVHFITCTRCQQCSITLVFSVLILLPSRCYYCVRGRFCFALLRVYLLANLLKQQTKSDAIDAIRRPHLTSQKTVTYCWWSSICCASNISTTTTTTKKNNLVLWTSEHEQRWDAASVNWYDSKRIWLLTWHADTPKSINLYDHYEKKQIHRTFFSVFLPGNTCITKLIRQPLFAFIFLLSSSWSNAS